MLREDERQVATRMLDNKFSPYDIAATLLVNRIEQLPVSLFLKEHQRLTNDIEVMDICNYDHSPIWPTVD